jgi:cytochrome c biogenesis protein CcdA/thiol-disulfide isomerase/thioredoxin
MLLLIGFAFLAGVLTVASPCVLPLLPVILAGSAAGGKRRPLGIIAGFVLSFTTLTLGLSYLVGALGLDPDRLRAAAAVVIILMALVLIVPALKTGFAALAGRLVRVRPSAGAAGRPAAGDGWWPGVLTGLSLGVVWTPCVGPIMASVIGLAASRRLDSGGALLALVYAAGTALPLFAVMAGGRGLLRRFGGLAARLEAIQRLFGVLMLAAGAALLVGADRRFQAWVLDAFPGYGAGLTAVEDTPAVRDALAARASGAAGTAGAAPAAAAAIPDRNGADPLARTDGRWLNSPPLTLEALKGKVVLVDFWTYSCINCLRTLPYLRAWQERYAAAGLVIVGVHTPEFGFEADADNLAAAVRDLKVTWPVVQDNGYGIWNAFANRYWPSHYLFAPDGALVETRFGEGGYAETEAAIRRLLGLAAGAAAAPADAPSAAAGVNPETYLGAARGQPLAAAAALKAGGFAWRLEGGWTQTDEYLESAADGESTLYLDVRAAAVYAVVSAAAPGAAIEVAFAGRSGAAGPSVRIVPDGDKLYRLFGAADAEPVAGTLILRVRGRLRLHALTFS